MTKARYASSLESRYQNISSELPVKQSLCIKLPVLAQISLKVQKLSVDCGSRTRRKSAIQKREDILYSCLSSRVISMNLALSGKFPAEFLIASNAHLILIIVCLTLNKSTKSPSTVQTA
ncbi:Hypothetical_protein [Hexamita inflata]|uniref:Hypothetical_protein n=1 Tax=Hexamita inflata TaxID=28002 RepID=A0AA86U7W9_9EUKA|nr:Hypothetical protein HINF_LOCUS28772 [Hexamita inflata]